MCGAHQSGGVTLIELTAANSSQSMSAVPIKKGFRPAQITYDACAISSPGPARYPALGAAPQGPQISKRCRGPACANVP